MHALGVVMARTGRKRKFGPRFPNGQLHREHRDSPRMVALGMPHRKDLKEIHQLDQRAESQLGRMRLRGQISENQFLAGQRFSKVVGAYMATIGPPRVLGGSGRGFDCPGLSDCPDCICARRRQVYMSAHDHVMDKVGRRATVALKTVVCHDQPCPAYLVSHLGWALSALSQHFGIGKLNQEEKA